MTRIEREERTVEAMIRLYCRDRHGTAAGLCAACGELAAFARRRLEKCPFQGAKPTCAHCSIHCYRARAGERERMREVMRYAGPRMIFRHPILALRHMLDGRRPVPELPRRRLRGPRPPVRGEPLPT